MIQIHLKSHIYGHGNISLTIENTSLYIPFLFCRVDKGNEILDVCLFARVDLAFFFLELRATSAEASASISYNCYKYKALKAE